MTWIWKFQTVFTYKWLVCRCTMDAGMFVNDCITCILGYAHDAELIFNDLAITLFAWTVEYSTKLTLALLSRFYRQQIELSTSVYVSVYFLGIYFRLHLIDKENARNAPETRSRVLMLIFYQSVKWFHTWYGELGSEFEQAGGREEIIQIQGLTLRYNRGAMPFGLCGNPFKDSVTDEFIALVVLLDNSTLELILSRDSTGFQCLEKVAGKLGLTEVSCAF